MSWSLVFTAAVAASAPAAAATVTAQQPPGRCQPPFPDQMFGCNFTVHICEAGQGEVVAILEQGGEQVRSSRPYPQPPMALNDAIEQLLLQQDAGPGGVGCSCTASSVPLSGGCTLMVGLRP